MLVKIDKILNLFNYIYNIYNLNIIMEEIVERWYEISICKLFEEIKDKQIPCRIIHEVPLSNFNIDFHLV